MNKLLCIFTGLFMIFTLSACQMKSKNDPTEVINGYYQDMKDNNVESAYEKLSESSKQYFPKEDFNTCMKYLNDSSRLKDIKLEKSNEYTDKEIGGITYKNVVEFKVTEVIEAFPEDEDKTYIYNRNVVNENGTWKVYKETPDSKKSVAEAMTNYARMYFHGRGKPQDFNQTATILNKALKYSEDHPGTYYYLGCSYLLLERYDDAIDAINKFFPKAPDNEYKSYGYNVLGEAYMGKKQIDKAIEAFNKSLELNPNNQNAKNNLQKLK